MSRRAASAALAALAVLMTGCSAPQPAADQPADYPCTVTSLDGAAAPSPLRPDHPTIPDDRHAMRGDAPIPCSHGAR